MFSADDHLDAALADLEDRGLIGWDRVANRYDLHPVIRGVVWKDLGQVGQRIVYEQLQRHFEVMPNFTPHEADTLERLTTGVELYYTLIGLQKFDEAYGVFRSYPSDAALVELSECRRGAEWLEELFPAGPEQPPMLSDDADKIVAACTLAYAYFFCGRPHLATRIWTPHRDWVNIGLAATLTGDLYQADLACRRALMKPSDIALRNWAFVLSVRGESDLATRVFRRAIEQLAPQRDEHETAACALAGWHALEQGDLESAKELAERAIRRAEELDRIRPLIYAKRVQAAVAMRENRLQEAEELLHATLKAVRKIECGDEEVSCLIDLAEVSRLKGNLTAAVDFLEDVWDPVLEGGYRLSHASAALTLARIESQRRPAAAIAAADKAYRLAWCDGPPFAFAIVLSAAAQVLQELSAPVPRDLPLFTSFGDETVPDVTSLARRYG